MSHLLKISKKKFQILSSLGDKSSHKVTHDANYLIEFDRALLFEMKL